jgi:NAD(P)H dehydrogenase (quinone)
MGTYTIIGVTGNVGSTAATRLLGSGHAVRAYVRSEAGAAVWRGRGADPFLGDLYDADALASACDGVDGVFVMTPTWFEADDMFAENARALEGLDDALRRTSPKRVVLLSSIGAQHAHGAGAILKLHAMERRFADLPAVTSVRAAWFMENFAGSIAYVRETGLLRSMLAPLDKAIPMVATGDIGVVVANALDSEWSGQRVIELEGPRRYSPDDVATAFAAVLGRPVQTQTLPESEWLATWRSWGLTPRSADAMYEMLCGFNSSWIAFERESEPTKGDTPLEAVLTRLATNILTANAVS